MPRTGVGFSERIIARAVRGLPQLMVAGYPFVHRFPITHPWAPSLQAHTDTTVLRDPSLFAVALYFSALSRSRLRSLGRASAAQLPGAVSARPRGKLPCLWRVKRGQGRPDEVWWSLVLNRSADGIYMGDVNLELILR